jgi:Cu/Ag efflux pump CusA
MVLQWRGYTFSSIVLLGLLLALAVIVQDAVTSTAVVMSALAKSTGDEPVLPVTSRVALAYREFGRTFVGASAVALVCLVPLFVATGLTATFLRPMVLAFGLAVVTSMLVALLISPALAAVLLAAGTKREPWGLVVARGLRSAYSVVLRPLLMLGVWPLWAVSLIAVAGLAITLPMIHPSPPIFQDRDLDVAWTGAPGMSLTELNRITALADRELLAIHGVQQVSATLGRAATSDQIDNTNTGHIWIELKPTADYAKTVAAVDAIVAGTPGMRGTVSTYETDSTTGVLAAASGDADVRIYGPDLPELTRLAYGVRSMMSKVHGLGSPHIQEPVVQPTINVQVNADAAQLYGLTPGDVRREAGTLMLGLTVGNFFQQDKVFDVVVKAQPDLVSNLTDVENLLIDYGNNSQVRLGSVATVSLGAEPEDIQHDQFSPFLDITAPVTGGDAGLVDAAINRGLTGMSFPLEYHAQLEAQSSGGTSRPQFISFIIAALLGIVLIGQAAVGSWRLTLLAMAAILPPVAVGGLVAHNMGSTSLSAAAGLLAVVVIALRQAIGVIGRIRRRHVADGGELTRDLLVTGSAESAASVIISTLVTVLMLLPFIVLGETAGTETVHGAAVVIASGIGVAALVNLLLLPGAALAAGPTAPVPAEIVEPPTGDLAWVTASQSLAV